jgi:regulatory protein
MLARRPFSTEELRRRLAQPGGGGRTASTEIEAVIVRLTAVGLLDDAAYATVVARSKLLGAGVSTRRLRAELARRRVDRTVADQAIQEVVADEAIDMTAQLEAIARKKLRSLAGLDPRVRRRRAFGFLARRGYGAEEIRRALETALAAEHHTEPLDSST